MSRQISNWGVVAAILISSLVLIGLSLKIGYDKGYSDKSPVYREVIKVVEVPYSLTDNSTISATQGLAILEVLAAPHAYMIAHPELQSSVTGNTTFNQSILIEYSAVSDLIKWQQNKILELKE